MSIFNPYTKHSMEPYPKTVCNAYKSNRSSEELQNDAWDTGMDAEMQEGFLEFLKMSNQIKR